MFSHFSFSRISQNRLTYNEKRIPDFQESSLLFLFTAFPSIGCEQSSSVFLFFLFFSASHQSANAPCFLCRKAFPAIFQNLIQKSQLSGNLVFQLFLFRKFSLQIAFHFFIFIQCPHTPYLYSSGVLTFSGKFIRKRSQISLSAS